MILINRAILHILDLRSNITVFSENELDLTHSSIYEFISKHIEKSYQDPASRTGVFQEESIFPLQLKSYLNEELNFVTISTNIAEAVYMAVSQSALSGSAAVDLIICDFTYDNIRNIGILEYNNRIGYTHQVIQEEGKIRNEIINHYSILPNPTQKVDTYAFVNCNDLSLKFYEKKTQINEKNVFILQDMILQCTSALSQKEAIRIVQKATRKIAEDHGENSVAALSTAKSLIVENAETSDYIEPKELIKEVFEGSAIMQEEFIEELEKYNLSEPVYINRELAVKTSSTHKIKTDTGIELSFPTDYSQNSDFIEFINQPDGTISIQLKNINKIVNR